MKRLAFLISSIVISLSGVFPTVILADTETYIEVTTARGVQQPFWLIEKENAVASLILFAGGKGKLKITASGIKKGKNFLVRSRDMFAGHGFNVAVIDVPSDHGDLFGFRTTADHASDIQAVIHFLNRKYHKPVWLIGTSRGTLSAANAAARLSGADGPAGIVLTSSIVVGGNHESLYDIELAAIKTPTLIVHNREDGCHVCPFDGVAGCMDKMTKVKEKALQVHSGGRSEQSNPCKALTPHGFLGLEEKVVKDIVSWIKPRL